MRVEIAAWEHQESDKLAEVCLELLHCALMMALGLVLAPDFGLG